jgi:MFS family permease
VTTHELAEAWNLSHGQSAWLTTSVQLGFIIGTFLYAFLNLADRFNARRVFFISALLGALFNALYASLASDLTSAILFRFLTGLTLAGIYPVGMKIIASWFRSGLGWRLGVLVGALVVGTASPFLIHTIGAELDWRILTVFASMLAIAGGFLILTAIQDGPYLKERPKFDAKMMFSVFKNRAFRYTAFGYFGHMWELYAVWALISFFLIESFSIQQPDLLEYTSIIVFLTIGLGGVGCVIGGWISRIVGERKIALFSLILSGGICALSGFIFSWPPVLLIPIVLIWGFFVVSDSPQFSALAAKHCPPEYTGTALTIQNGIGFTITLFSIQLLPILASEIGWQWVFVVLAIGPILGSYFMWKLGKIETN